MPTAEPLPDNIRRIAVLVASVDSATARQLLLHLPTLVAKQVRRALQNLGPISPAERQRILTEFQATAAKQNQSAANQPLGAPVAAPQAPSFANNSANPAQNVRAGSTTNDGHKSGQVFAPSLAEHSERGGSPLYSTPPLAFEDASQPSWKQMDIRALGHFLCSERAIVIAVVINQLSPDTGVALLQQLPSTTHREVLQAIANLQDIDEEAMRSIEEHLAERIKDYEQQVNSEAKGTRRVAALLAAAPPELQESWSRFVHIAIDASQDSSSGTQSMSQLQSLAASSAKEPKQTTTSEKTTAKSMPGDSPVSSQVVTTVDASMADSTSPFADSALDEDPHILQFPGASDPRPLSDTDRSLIQLEFEQILNLSTHQLAQVLTAAESQTVLLALAGASPSFMKRFYAMLTKADGKALASRLSKIGPLKLREIDEAQRSIAELAARFLAPHSYRVSQSQPLRVAA
jgi:flagellar motor switch protein FliG